MNGCDLPLLVFGNMAPPNYRVDLPPGQEPVYQWAARIFLGLAVIAGGLWLARSRTVRTAWARALLWAAAGCLAVSYSAWWVWSHRNGPDQYGGFGSTAWLAVCMPLVWAVAAVVVIVWGWRSTRPRPGCPECRPAPGRDQPALCPACGRPRYPAAVPENWGKAGACPRCGFSYLWDGALCSHCGPGDAANMSRTGPGRQDMTVER